MPKRYTAEEATQLIMERGFSPIGPYPGAKVRWKAKHLECGGVLLDEIGEFQSETAAPIYVELREHGTKVLLDFNPARQMDPDGDTLCHPDVVEATVIWRFSCK